MRKNLNTYRLHNIAFFWPFFIVLICFFAFLLFVYYGAEREDKQLIINLSKINYCVVNKMYREACHEAYFTNRDEGCCYNKVIYDEFKKNNG